MTASVTPLPTAKAPPVTTATAPAPVAVRPKPPIVEVRNIVQEYDQPNGKVLRVLDDITLRFDKPSINMLLGPSGCGKSTLMKMFGGVRDFNVRTPTSGSVFIEGKVCDSHHEDTIMVFQQYNNRPDMTVHENVAYPFKFKEWSRRVSKADAEKRVDDMLNEVGLSDKRDQYPSQLSGGQNQRVALARALVTQPKILLMDEPFGALDAQTRSDMQGLLVRLHRDHPCVIVFVTHDVSEALLLGDRVIVLSTQPAKVIDDFAIPDAHPRDISWLERKEIRHMNDTIVKHLRQSGSRGSIKVIV